MADEMLAFKAMEKNLALLQHSYFSLLQESSLSSLTAGLFQFRGNPAGGLQGQVANRSRLFQGTVFSLTVQPHAPPPPPPCNRERGKHEFREMLPRVNKIPGKCRGSQSVSLLPLPPQKSHKLEDFRLDKYFRTLVLSAWKAPLSAPC